jgi:LAO/AO transport system ATPase
MSDSHRQADDSEQRRDVPLRIVLAKVGLDGHDRGIKVVARGLRDAGFHVIYGGLWQTPEVVAQTVVDEDADWLGLSLLSGAHNTLVPRVLDALKIAGAADVPLMLGGIIAETDVPELRAQGVRGVFGPGTSIETIATFLHAQRPDRTSSPGADSPLGSARRALSRALTIAAQGDELPNNLVTQFAARPRTISVGVTGSAGVGKSSLIGKLVAHLRSKGQRVAVLACDPESSVSGGALLGDRIRISATHADEGVFLRSLPVTSGQQGVAPHVDRMIKLLSQGGFDVVIVETTGIGQGDMAVRNSVDVLVVLVQPATGDALQWEKAGVLEVADIVVVHKSDLAGAERVAADMYEQLHLAGGRTIPVVRASAARNEGLEELWAAVSGIVIR